MVPLVNEALVLSAHLREIFTAAVDDVTALLTESRTVTCTPLGELMATPAVVSVGCALKSRWSAAPMLIVKVLLVAGDTPPPSAAEMK